MTERITQAQAIEAAKRLLVHDDYKVVYSYMAGQFDVDMRHVLSDPANNELFIAVGRARAFDYTLRIMRGEIPRGNTTKTID